MIHAEIKADSLAPSGQRLVTFVVTLPRFILAELNTHRALSRNTASSRAIPTYKLLRAVIRTPFVPSRLGRNGRGMQAKGELTGWRLRACLALWLLARWPAVAAAWSLNKLGLHKQWANRLIEPWLYVTAIVSGTDLGNFFNLRCHKDAQPEFQEVAFKMLEALAASTPKPLAAGEWHLPFADKHVDAGMTVEQLVKIVTARCARVSYLTFDGGIDPASDFKLHDDLLKNGHMSPFEHAAMAAATPRRSGNFVGFVQYRKTLCGENRTDFDANKLLAGRKLAA